MKALWQSSVVRRTALVLLAAVLLGILVIGQSVVPAQAQTTNLAQGKPVTCSSTENASFPCANAVDGNTGTRWSSAFSDPQWITVDLGATYTVNRVVLNWEAAYGRSYQIQVSGSASGPWTTIYSTTTGNGATDDLALSGSGRYVRMNGTARATQWGYSLFEFQVFSGGTPPPTTPPPTTPPPTTPPPTTPPPTTPPPSGNLALRRPVTCSSIENAGTPCASAVDGSSTTRWSSAFSDPQWIYVDLGATYTINRVVLNWEAAYGRSYQIQVGANTSSWTTIYSTTTGNGATDDLAISGTGRYVRMNGTARATAYGYSLWEFQVFAGGTPPPTTPPPTTPPPTTPPPTTPPPTNTAFWGDTTNIPPANNVLMFKFLNRTNGTYPDNQIYWSFNGQTRSIAEAPYFDMPANSAGRMYFYLGAPNSQYQDFIEFTIGPTVFNGNTTRVDWFGIKLAMRLRADDGYDVAVGEDLATFQETREATFQKFINEVPAEFDHLAQAPFAPYRIPAPAKMGDTAFAPGGQYANYFTAYASSVGVSASTSDIFGCAGSLAGNPTMCAALNRHTAHLPSSSWENSSLFYQAAPANYYAKFWHDHSLQAMAYGFPYDDVGGYSSFISHGNPTWLIVAIGW